jgi:transcriptional regulator GlxA family with amidase domain
MPRKKIVIVILSRNHLMDFAGPADVFTHANELRDCYDIELVSPTDNLTGFYGGVDTLLLTGNDDAPGNKVFFSWLRGEHDNIRRIGFVGVGSAILEKTGLPLDRNFFHTRDGHVYTSGGVSSGIDLALAMVEEDCGMSVAYHIASKLIFFYLSRQVYQIQFGNLVDSSPLAEQLKGWLAGRLNEPLPVNLLAEKMNMSTRNFTRVFTSQTGLSPAKFIEKLRVDEACNLLVKTDDTLERIAVCCGMGGLVSMRRLFLRHLTVTPSEYRRLLKLHKYENSY